MAAAWLQACDQQGGAAGKPLIYVGDLNVAAADVDLSHPSYFRNIQMDKQAGGRGTIAPENRGQPGCTDNERRRFREMLDAGQLVDVYRRRQQQQQLGSEASASASAAAAAAGGGSFGSDGSAGCSDDDQHRCVRPSVRQRPRVCPFAVQLAWRPRTRAWLLPPPPPPPHRCSPPAVACLCTGAVPITWGVVVERAVVI
eukprot:COSAG01_NODE_20_length_38868_cov_34.606071_20_plen_199_part_00